MLGDGLMAAMKRKWSYIFQISFRFGAFGFMFILKQTHSIKSKGQKESVIKDKSIFTRNY